MSWLILICLVIFATERLCLLNWYDEDEITPAKVGGAIQAILAMMAVVGQIMEMMR